MVSHLTVSSSDVARATWLNDPALTRLACAAGWSSPMAVGIALAGKAGGAAGPRTHYGPG